ncbi:AAA family ATPase [Flavihumibacter sp. UBA7668]|uniref:AAA family ATPase n=1 Tax=Flavihumibacter sp. UBA7668 TaxID=1946542 RepID=UPI0025C52B15|nr:AAA family ATPase [Flavihumibacter sp. UBA7668]
MKINKLKIEGVGGIKFLDLSFNERMNLLCGPNGIGKTTILESIAHIFSNGNTNILKRNVASEISSISAEIDINGAIENKQIQFDTFIPESTTRVTGFHLRASGLISLKTTRTFQYQSLQAVSKDSNKENHILWNDAINGINLTDIKNWFVNRYLYSPHSGALTAEQLKNFELAKKCFSLLNEAFAFSKVNASSNEIMINTPSGEIYYEYLSSGFKSIISILFGIIKEIEFRFKDPKINAEDFQGIILIDEIELHLHPEWQEKIVDILLEVFPKAQFFASTHSPHVIQTAKPKQIIALGFDNNNVIQRELPSTEFGFQGWTIEEVLIDVMGMKNLRTEIFEKLISQFDKAIEEENIGTAEEIYSQLDKLLHSENTLRKLLKFQLAGLR